MSSFKDFKLFPKIQTSLETLNFINPTEIQAKVIPLLLESPKTDIHVQAQTGTGKTLAFGIPLLHIIDVTNKNIQGLIVAPTRELVLQIFESLKEVSRGTNIVIEPIYGGMPINRQIINIKKGAQIIVGTPGRINDHLRRKTLLLNTLKVLVLDEADIMLDMGFKEEVDAILSYAPKERQIWLFSATVMPGIKNLIKSHMHNVLTIKSASVNVVSSQVKQYYCIATTRNRIEAISRFIEAAPNFYGIIFCQTKVLTTEVTEELASKGFKINCLHGDMKQTLRNHVIKGFKGKDFNILVATDVAARGIDVSDLTHVINFSIPDEYEKYIHRIGRTGRAGKEGLSITFIASSELHKLKRLERAVHTTLQEIPVPAIENIINTKITAVSDFIEQSKNPKKELNIVHDEIIKLIQSFSEEEIKNSLAVALEDKFFKDIIHEKLDKFQMQSSIISQEICLEIGQEHGFSDDTLRHYLYNTCKLLPQELTKVRVLKNKTFISMPENRVNDCLNKIRLTPIENKKFKSYLVRDNYQDRKNFVRKRNNQNKRRY